MSPFLPPLRTFCLLGAALLAIGMSAPSARAAATPAAGHWAAAWATAPQDVAAGTTLAFAQVENQTIRQTVRLTLAGDQLQVRLSNEYGTRPLRIGAASISSKGQVRALTFGGGASIVIPPGAPAVSDPVSLPVARLGEAEISLYLPDRTAIQTVHSTGLHTTLVSAPGDFTRQSEFPVTARSSYRVFLTGVSVWATQPTQVIAALGASIVDGFRSTVDTYGAWPDRLADRLAASSGVPTGVVNLGISGNRVTSDGGSVSALARFDRDVLSQPGLTHMILFEGRNDLSLLPRDGADAQALFTAYQQIVHRARQRGIKVIAAPVTPDGTTGWTDAQEADSVAGQRPRSGRPNAIGSYVMP